MKSANNWLILMIFFYKKMKRIIKERTVLNMMIDYTFVYTTNFLWYSNYYKYLIYYCYNKISDKCLFIYLLLQNGREIIRKIK